MAKIALIWELGADLGHITRYSIIARELLSRGHEPIMMLHDVSRVRDVIPDDSVVFYQTPECLFKPKGLPPPLNLTETLFMVGFLEQRKLLSLTKSWRHTFETIDPDVLVFDHAPVAQLAARGLHYRQIIVTNSFSVPPDETPLPPYRFWHEEPALRARLEETEQRCKTNANFVLKALGEAPLDTMAELFQLNERVICERPEFDVYGQRTDVSYVGPINDDSLGKPPNWPANTGPKIFAYLKIAFPHIDRLLSILSKLSASTIAYVPGLSTPLRDKYQNNSLYISEEPLQLNAVAEQCDYALCHGGTGTVNSFLESGIPVFALPLFVEQMMFSKRVEAAGLGSVFPLQGEAKDLSLLLKRFLDDESLTARVSSWASHADIQSMQSRIRDVCDRIETLI